MRFSFWILFINLILFVSCNQNAYLVEGGSISPFVDLSDISSIVTPGTHNLSGSCLPNGSVITVDCGTGSSAPVLCSGGAFTIPSVSISSLPATCSVSSTPPGGTALSDDETTGSPVTTWLLGQIELENYINTNGEYTFRNSSKTSPNNNIVNTSWEIIPTVYSSNGYNGSSSTSGTGEIFSFLAPVVDVTQPTNLYDTCDTDSTLYEVESGAYNVNELTSLEFSGFWVEGGGGTIDQSLGSVVGGIFIYDSLAATPIQTFVESTLDAQGVVYSSVSVTVSNTFPYLSLNILGLQPISTTLGIRFPNISYSIRGTGESSGGLGSLPGEGLSYLIAFVNSFEDFSNCSAGVTTISGANHDFTLKMTTTDNLGNTVTTHSLFWLRDNYLGVLIPGADISVSGTILNLNDDSVSILDSSPPDTVYDDFYLDINADGTDDYNQTTTPGFVHDYVLPGSYSGKYSIDDADYWGMGSGEVFSEYIINIP